ncbi:MAG: sugar phosphate isomerase/epimerase [Clostridiaceae bacterium]|jgi:sugar phosphate isomerase/epimerase|nr:sugar phosphate isomerase/epimerase [Clostridiaceae bacterium]
MEIGVQTIGYGKFIDEWQAVKHISKAGFTVLDYSLEDAAYLKLPMKDFKKHFEDMRKHIQEHGMTTGQTHTPFYPYTKHMQNYDEVLELQKRALIATALLGSKYAVVHPLKPKDRVFDKYTEETFELNKAYYSKLVPILAEYNVNICIENLYTTDEDKNVIPSTCSTGEELAMYIDRMGDRFYACLDTGHVNLVQREGYEHVNFKHMTSLLGERLKIVHIHDNDKKTDLHYAPYLGTIDWNEFTDSLKAIRYEGNLSLESFTFMNKINRDNIDEGLKMMYMAARRLYERFMR